VLHKEDLAMLINGITNTLNATWSFWLRPAHVYSQEVLERRELRYKKKTHTHTGSIDESLLSSSVTVAVFFLFLYLSYTSLPFPLIFSSCAG
jgi:hypothetical protein